MAKISTTKILNGVNHGINILTAMATILAVVKAVRGQAPARPSE